MIGGDGINDESNKTAPAPDTQIYLTKDTRKYRSCNAAGLPATTAGHR